MIGQYNKVQVGFMPGCRTKDTISIFRWSQNYRRSAFVNLEKGFDQVFRVVW